MKSNFSMKRLKIVTDMVSDLPIDLAQKFDIEIVPLTIVKDDREMIFADQSDRGNYEKDLDDYYSFLAKTERLPTTAQPPPEKVREIYSRLLEKYDAILSINASGKLSGTYSVAESVAREFGNRIIVIDSEQVTIPLSLLVLEAAKDKGKGLVIDEIVQRVKENMCKVRPYATLDSLHHLVIGGRIGRVKYVLGVLLNRKPIITLVDGVLDGVAKVKEGFQMDKIIELMETDIGQAPLGAEIIVMAFYTAKQTKPKMEKLATVVESTFKVKEMSFARIGQVVATHLGPTAWGLCYLKL